MYNVQCTVSSLQCISIRTQCTVLSIQLPAARCFPPKHHALCPSELRKNCSAAFCAWLSIYPSWVTHPAVQCSEAECCNASFSSFKLLMLQRKQLLSPNVPAVTIKSCWYCKVKVVILYWWQVDIVILSSIILQFTTKGSLQTTKRDVIGCNEHFSWFDLERFSCIHYELKLIKSYPRESK